ncbi:hypothetical protein DASC09_017640 [Saccharomycopsis crataegensis]|uniref:Uncharacterized protein n=1 Tax=Saccharomycopsis crataegensis TaxID=43959 RepID=A0AAV5QJ36_9ASCO|nr:hypothetical protein DASC09_017640 [Saccharomycopsis crataegensis]
MNQNGIWENILRRQVAGRSLRSKCLVLITSNIKDQRRFLERIGVTSLSTNNDFGWGYIFQEIKDTQQDELVLKLNIHTVVDTGYDNERNVNHFVEMLKTFVLSKFRMDDVLMIPVLNCHSASSWIGFLAKWISIFDKTFGNTEEGEKLNTKLLEQFKINSLKFLGSNISMAPNIVLKEFECDHLLGCKILLYIVGASELSHDGIKGDFEYAQQALRVVALKHGGSIVFAKENQSKDDKILLGVMGLSLSCDFSSGGDNKDNKVVPNAVSFDQLVIPLGYDSVGKISVSDEEFDIAEFATAWQNLIDGKDSIILEKYKTNFAKNGPVNSESKLFDNREDKVIDTSVDTLSLNDFLRLNYSASPNLKNENRTIDKLTQEYRSAKEDSSKVRDFFETLKLKNKEI